MGPSEKMSSTQSKAGQFVRKHPIFMVLTVAIVAAVGLVATRPANEPAPRRERVWVVETIPVEKTSLRPSLELFGSVLSPQDAELSAGIEANVIAVSVRDGETVSRGQRLARLDSRDAELALRQEAANVLEIEARYEIAQRRLEFSREALEKEQEVFKLAESRQARAQELFDLKRLSNSDYENATENFKRQQIQLNDSELTLLEDSTAVKELEAQLIRADALQEQATLMLERADITAPFDGVVSEPQISVGDRVRVGDPLMRIQNPESIEIRTQVPARYAKSLSTALARAETMAAVIEVEGVETQGKLLRISALTRESSGGVDAFVGLTEQAQGLRLGSTVKVNLELAPEADVFAVPAEAVYGLDRIYVRDGDRMKMAIVERVGDRSMPDGRTETLLRSSSLQDGVEVIITKLANPSDGLKIKISQSEPGSNDSDPDQAALSASEGEGS